MGLEQGLGLNLNQQTPINIMSGYVSTEQPAPTSFDALVSVVIPTHSTEVSIGLPFNADHGGTLPARGAQCMVALDEYDNGAVIWWQGTYTTP